MKFKHGFVHCDPHAANLLVRLLPSGERSIFCKKKPQLILLDHGLYKELDFFTKYSYASLWRALGSANSSEIKVNSMKLGAGEDLYELFAGILTMRPWNSVIDPAIDHLVIKGTDCDRSELQVGMLECMHLNGSPKYQSLLGEYNSKLVDNLDAMFVEDSLLPRTVESTK
ncbi:putative ABC1 protein At2g40090 isoform X2 [Durio zibethinus]|uniref:ABC1 protein At2g40090 isoform X2 n=1 Tax=Durio zibethinus TaxID=66656 RepID=A0A6P5XC66_DURZI|nr:putative ABC1 protein At2g40090 isoform X2 [Durio zibethinus]